MVWLQLIFDILPSLILGLMGLLITCKYQKHQKSMSDDRLLKELFTEFNHRYDELNSNLIKIQNEFPTLELLEKAEEKDELRNTIIDFFNLCAEEKYWHTKGRIEDEIWRSWSSGMNYWYNNVPVIKEMWKNEIKDDNGLSYYITNGDGFFQE